MFSDVLKRVDVLEQEFGILKSQIQTPPAVNVDNVEPSQATNGFAQATTGGSPESGVLFEAGPGPSSVNTDNMPPDDDASMDVDMDIDQPLCSNSKKLALLDKIAGSVNPFKGANKGSAGYRFRKNGGSRRGGRPFR